MANVRGSLISVVDLARFCGMQPTPIDKDSRIIAFSPALSFNGGLLVSRIMGLRNAADMQPESAADAGVAPWAAHRYVDRESQAWTEINLSLIVQDTQFLHVGI